MQTLFSLTHNPAARTVAMFMLISWMMIVSTLISPNAAFILPNL